MASETKEEAPTEPVEPAESSDPAEAVESSDPVEPAEPTEEEEPAAEQDIQEWSDDELPPADGGVPEPPAVEEEKTEDADTEKVENLSEPVATEEAEDPVPDFSKYRTNVAERLWRATQVADNEEEPRFPDIITYEKDFQAFRKKMGLLNKYVDEYATALKEVSEKRNQLIEQYAKMSEGTPLWDRVGKPLTEEQKSEIEECGDLKTMEGIEARTHAIMKVADDIGAGSVMAHQQLAKMQDEMSLIDFKKHTALYIDEWDDVISTEVDEEVKEVRMIGRKREHYLQKVDKLRERVNRIEHKGKQSAPKKLTDQLFRNEKKLSDCDATYLDKANEASILLYEATERGWVDFYPVIKNVMKFEINRLGRESACYGSYHDTLEALKTDYRMATKGTPDEPHHTSRL